MLDLLLVQVRAGARTGRRSSLPRRQQRVQYAVFRHNSKSAMGGSSPSRNSGARRVRGASEGTRSVSRTSELQVQAPVCTKGSIIGWHAFGSLPLDGEDLVLTRVRKTSLEWAGFVLNARAVWKDDDDQRPKWIKDWTEWANPERNEFVELKSVVSDESKIEALGNCGKGDAVLVWWARSEARSDSKWPSR